MEHAAEVRVDPEAVARYARAAEEVAAGLTAAAASASGAADIDRLTAELGSVGADFAAKWCAAVGAHVDALTAAAALITGYGEGLSQHSQRTAAADSDTADAIARAGERGQRA